MHRAGIPYSKLWTKFEVVSLNSFENILDCLPGILWVTWPSPFGENYSSSRSAFPRRSCVQNWSL